MVIIFAISIIPIFFRIEQQISSKQLKSHTSQRPHISSQIILRAKHNLRTTILPRLYFSSEMMMLPACITQICNFNSTVLSNTSFCVIEWYFMFEIHEELFDCFVLTSASWFFCFFGFLLLWPGLTLSLDLC